MTTGRALGVGVVGFGYWGRNYGRVFEDLPASRVAAVCDPSPAGLETAAAKLPHVLRTSRLEEMLAQPDVDVVVVCTPATTHYKVARACLEAGRHVLVEKPFTTNSQEGEALARLAALLSLKIVVGHTFVYNEGVIKLKEIVSSGELGRLHYLYSRRTNLGPFRQDVNAIWDLAPHDISVFNHLLGGPPVRVSATGKRVLGSHREDVGFMSLTYPGDVLAHVHVSWADPHKVRETVIVGSRRRAVFDDLATTEPIRVFDKGIEAIELAPEGRDGGGLRLLMRDGDIHSPRLPSSEPLKTQCLAFIESVLSGTAPQTGPREGIDVVRVLEAVDSSLANEGAPVDVEQPELAVTGTVR